MNGTARTAVAVDKKVRRLLAEPREETGRKRKRILHTRILRMNE